MNVDFYLLTTHDDDAVWLMACRLLEKAYLRGHRVYVYCESEEDAGILDERLWTFKDDSFVPHHLRGEGPEPPPPIQIGFKPTYEEDEPRGFDDILLNLSKTLPSFTHRFRRILHVISAEETAKNLGRQHYREYQKRGVHLTVHDMGAR